MAKVLVVDNCEARLVTSAAALRLCGYEVITASSGQVAKALVSERDLRVVLVNLHLPDMSGLDLVKHYRDCGFTEALFVVSSSPDIASSFRAGAVGATAYVEGPLSGNELEYLVDQAVAHISVQRNTQRSRVTPLGVHCQHQDRRIRTVMRVIDSNPSAQWSIEELAASVGVSPSRLRHQFASVVGLSLSRYITLRRLQHLRILLTVNDGPIMTIARRAGFRKDSKRIRQLFRMHFGLSPRQYRDRFGQSARLLSGKNSC